MSRDKLIFYSLNAYLRTLRVRVLIDDGCLPSSPRVYVFWHGRMLLLPFVFRRFSDRVKVLISRHSDGELAAKVVSNFGFSSVRGSAGKGKGGVSAALRMIDEVKNGYSVAIPVDGPRGPAFKVKKGAALVSLETGVPVCPVSFRCSRGRKLGSWDRFFIPYPFSSCTVKVGKPLIPDAGESPGELSKRIELSLIDLERELEEEV